MQIYAKVEDLQEISTGSFTVRFQADGTSEDITEEVAAYLVGMFPAVVEVRN